MTVTSTSAFSQHWKAAAGSVSLTPDGTIWLGGYASRNEPSQGNVHDIYAKVMVVEDTEGSRLAIVTLDLLGVTPELRAGVEQMVQQHGIAPEMLLMNASHTHSGPELRPDRLERFDRGAEHVARAKRYVREVATKIADLVGETIARLEPAQLVYSYARAGFAMNRRLPTPNGFINSPNPEGPVDHQVPVLRIVNNEGDITGILFGYSCHATVLSTQLLCGDYPGFAQQYIEEAHPGAVALFLNGCSGDQNPYPRRSLELAQQHGRALANGVETALETKQTRQLEGPLRVALEYATLKFADPPTREELESRIANGNKYERIHAKALLDKIQRNGKLQAEHQDFPIQAIQLGPHFTLVAICGEVVVDYSLRLKKELARTDDDIVWVAGYSNHVFGYLPSKRIVEEGGYEGARAMQYTTYPGPFDPSVERRVVAMVKKLVSQVRNVQEAPATGGDQ